MELEDGYYIVSFIDEKERDFLLIGKIEDELQLEEIKKVLCYYYPFRCKIKKEKVLCYNFEDFLFLEKNFKVKIIFTMFGRFNKVQNFFSPNIVKIRSKEVEKVAFPFLKREAKGKDKVALVFPYFNPYDRGRLLEKVLEKTYEFILLPGYFIGENKDSLSTLACRYLLKQKQPYSSILKVKSSSKIEDILLESIEVLELFLQSFREIRIYCLKHQVCEIQRKIRFLRREGFFEKIKFRYFVE